MMLVMDKIQTDYKFTFKPTEPEVVYSFLVNIAQKKKSSGLDGIPTKILGRSPPYCRAADQPSKSFNA